MNKNELIDIWLDTESNFQNYPNKITSYIAKSSLWKEPEDKKMAEVLVINQDCIEVAKQLSNSGKTCMLNMASYKHPGGGVKRGAMSQEEELARRSNMMLGLELYDYAYPLGLDDYIYLKSVTFFKDKYYNITDEFDCDIITIAAINLNGLEKPFNYNFLMLAKIKSIFNSAKKEGCKNLVLSAFGCGVFKNNPTEVANMFKSVIKENLNNFDKIYFAILNDRNADNDNFTIFKTILSNQ